MKFLLRSDFVLKKRKEESTLGNHSIFIIDCSENITLVAGHLYFLTSKCFSYFFKKRESGTLWYYDSGES